MIILMDMFNSIVGRAVAGLCGVIIGAFVAIFLNRWKRHREYKSILRGDARDTVVIEHHLVESVGGPNGKRAPTVLRMRSLGQAQVERVVPNGYLAAELLNRAFRVTPRETLISMEGIEGSYLLETSTNFVCDCVGNAPFEHDLYVMAPCCEPAGLAVHQPIVIILIGVADLALFESWRACREVKVEHGSDGARVLTLMELANHFRAERRKIAALHAEGKRSTYVETSYLLDLALDKCTAAIPVQPVPWQRFDKLLAGMNWSVENPAILV